MSHARVFIDPHFTVGPINRRLFGSFVEHLGRCVYDGIYEPKHPTADANGFRADVIELVKELGISTIRYPGGNFVSGYRWEDGVGPRETRPRRRDLAWHSTETNEIGLHEFATWIEAVDAGLMLAVNLGTRGTAEALDLLEYANLRTGTDLADRRARNGRERPFDVRMWCLGNEMDGPWQLGHSSAEEYGRLASKTAKAMRQVDPDLQLVVCGSSSAHMPTFGEWERTVLTHTYEDVDYISCHAYYEERDGDLGSFLASAVDMDRFIEQVVATADHVKVKRSGKSINLSFDEWNVWYQTRFESQEKIQGVDNWPITPRLLEDVYTVADAVVVGSLLISLLNHADRVTSASLAQLVNVIAPIMTEPGGPAWRQTTFHPFALTSRWARGTAMQVFVECDSCETSEYGTVPSIAAAASYDSESGQTAVFLVNRSLETPTDVTVCGLERGEVAAYTISDADPYACDTAQAPERVRPEPNPNVRLTGGELFVTLPPVSWTAVTIARRTDDRNGVRTLDPVIVMGPRPPRMTDVAHLAGVSHTTVSRVLINEAGFRPEMRRRVQAAIAQLDYRRNVAARQLASRRSRTVGLVVNNLTQYGPASVAQAIQAAAKATPYTVSTVALPDPSVAAFHAAVDGFREQSVEALIVLVSTRQVLDMTRTLDIGMPILAVDGARSDLPLTAGVDQVDGARLATRHLVELGHRQIAHLAGPAESSEAAARRRGWQLALSEAGLPVPNVRFTGDWTARSGYDVGRELAHAQDVTAVFAANDQMALGLVTALRETGRGVPEDVSVVGFDDLPDASYFSPPLTTVRQDFTDLGQRAMDLIAEVLSGKAPQAQLVPPQLMIRSSTGRPPQPSSDLMEFGKVFTAQPWSRS